jgi:hypothetical protein
MGTKEGAQEENLLNAIRAAGADAKPHGCICPPGAESTCRGWGCPRNPPLGQKLINGELIWTR